MFPSQVVGAILFVVIILPFYSFTLIKDSGLKEASENLLRCSNGSFVQILLRSLTPAFWLVFKILMVFKKKNNLQGYLLFPLFQKLNFFGLSNFFKVIFFLMNQLSAD